MPKNWSKPIDTCDTNVEKQLELRKSICHLKMGVVKIAEWMRRQKLNASKTDYVFISHKQYIGHIKGGLEANQADQKIHWGSMN